MSKWLLPSLLGLALAGPAAAQEDATEARDDLTVIAVVRDGPSPDWPLEEDIADQLRRLMRDAPIEFRGGAEYDGGSTFDGTSAALDRALADPEVDIVVVTGAMGTAAASRRELDRPVVSSFPQYTDHWGQLDTSTGRSSKRNFAFLVLEPDQYASDTKTSRELLNFSAAHFFLPEAWREALPAIREAISALARSATLDIDIAFVSSDIPQTLASLPADVEVALLGQLTHLTSDQRAELIGGLNERKIPTFSLSGHPDVELGALAASLPDTQQTVARRTALSLSEIMRGRGTGELPVTLSVDRQLVINARTAAAIGSRLDYRTLALATVLHPEALEGDRTPLSLAQALEIAQQTNAALAVTTQDVETALQQQGVAKTGMLPQVFTTPTFTKRSVRGLEGFVPDRTLVAGVSVSQMIYDDRIVSDYKSAGKLHEATLEFRETQRLNVAEAAGRSYLRLVLAEILRDIDLENLRLTEDNLRLATQRLAVGHSGRDEVYRWEAEVAKRRSGLLDRDAEIETARISLNQVLGVDQSRRWQTASIEVDADVFPFLGGRLALAFPDIDLLARLRDSIVAIAIENAPELRTVQREREAQQLQLDQRKRRWWLPSFGAFFSWDYAIDRSELINDPERDNYVIQIDAVYPLFEGNRRAKDIALTTSEVQRIDKQMELRRQLVEQSARTAFQRVSHTFPSITLRQLAAEMAARNLDIVTDKYADGMVGITRLLEAQTESFTAHQQAAATTYSFLDELIGLQRSIAWFEDEKTPEERDILAARLLSVITGEAEGATR